ncbi:MAG: von Willebrand factor type A domain-containing protein [Chitinophagaceae bacterium]|nr:von Willebrand factor type A domain-containing protein [Chitinophagaceae bacterium]MCW5905753.1 von Willebrand factor type A domain-containing protein [Chitinophagaceae bacterium]
MKKVALLGIICVLFSTASAQFYLRGAVKDEQGRSMSNVMIHLFSKNNYTFSYKTGTYGTFGIPTSLEIDTIILSLPGYETIKKPINTRFYQNFVLKALPATASLMKNKLSSKTKNLLREQYTIFSNNGESYSHLIENEFLSANLYPETGFALNIDRASYSNIRRFLNNGVKVPYNAVRIEEMLNYFDYNLTDNNTNSSTANNQFRINHYLTTCPWNNQSNLLFLNFKAPKLNLDTIPASNLVFLIDISGSMDKPNRLPLLQTAFKMLVENLRDIDTVTIITYGGGVNKVLYPTSGADKYTINNVIDSLSASGDTPGEEAIQTAYASAIKSFIPKGNNRVILATDGDFNVGQTSDKALEELITSYMKSGIYLTCLGVGMGNYKDSKLEILSKKGNGNFAYIDNIYEAQKALVTEFTKTLYSVANDAFLYFNFNKEIIKEYRLIGFDNKKAAVTDSTSELEGGEVGSGHNMIAIFELMRTDNRTSKNIQIGQLSLQYKTTDFQINMNQILNINDSLINFIESSPSLQFATAVSMFGSLLKNSKYAWNYDYWGVYDIAAKASNPNCYAQQEFLRLVQTANKLYNPKQKRRRSR